MASDDERYVARLEFRKDATFYDAETIRDALAQGYRLDHNVTSGSIGVYADGD